MSRREDLERLIRRSYNLISQYKNTIRLPDEHIQRERDQFVINQQWELIDGYLKEYEPLCLKINYSVPTDIVEIATYFDASCDPAQVAASGSQVRIEHADQVIFGNVEQATHQSISASGESTISGAAQTGSGKVGAGASLATQPAASNSETPVDFVIITPLEEERDAVLTKLLGHRKLDPIPGDPYVYYQADLPIASGKGLYRLIVMPLVGMGRVKAVTATDAAIRRWDPRYVILVGIAGGVAAKGVNLGDVLVADKIVDYALQKQTAEGADIRWEVYNASTSLLAAAQNFKDDSWPDLVQVKRPRHSKPKRHIGPIASGDVVIDFVDVLNKYRETWSKLIGVEMEAGGVALSAFVAEKQVQFFMIRGVSDLADGDKDKPKTQNWRAYACDVAAAYAVGLLRSGPVVSLRGIDRKVFCPPETIIIPAGEFWMGSTDDDPTAQPNEKPQHKIFLPAYEIGKYPVTNAQYLEFVQATGHLPPTHWINGQIPPDKEDHPVVCVNFADAQAYCHWLSRKIHHPYRLPSEEEWEKAARGAFPDDRRYPWGSSWHQGYCNTCEDGCTETTSVTAFESTNESPFGVMDMAGNVWEWTSSVYVPYQDSVFSSGVSFVSLRYTVRGGACTMEHTSARISCRGRYSPNKCEAYLGFRVAMDIIDQG
ncbi:MAG: SUMF1/EgtB/PvdO family nonheme iron enzyme [Anaerolineae bacterium]|nr:SUMF1/EgtB/PvdO family nonheme iron enzyme [Anaerolineae bacterium]